MDEVEKIPGDNVTIWAVAFIIGDAVSDGICMVDNKEIVTRINRGYTDIPGINEEEILGKSTDL